MPAIEKIEDYKYALDESSIVAITDQKGIITYVNDNFCKISKYKREELIGQDHRLINSGYHSKLYIKDLWQTIASGKVWKGEFKNIAKDGTEYWVDTTIIPFLSQSGKPYQYVSIRSDITKRKKSERKLKKTLKEISDYKYALDESSIVAITNQNGVIKYANDNFCKISKYSRHELLGQNHRITNSGHHPKQVFQDLWKTISQGKVWKGELKNKAKDGAYYWVDTTIVPFLDQESKPYQYIAIRTDITKRKNAEEEIKKSKEELEDKVIERTRTLEIRNQQMVDFCNIISHNLRAPFVNISMLVDHIQESEEEEERIECIGKLKPVVQQLNEVFDELVESIQIKNDLEVQIESVNLESCLKSVLKRFECQLEFLRAEVQIEFNNIQEISYPQKYLDSIFLNLISNSIKYSSSDRILQLKISFDRKGDDVILSICDNGLGIDLKKYGSKIFKIRRTFHHHPEARGFGLFMTKTQVEAMDGEIWLESEPNIGSTFHVKFINQGKQG